MYDDAKLIELLKANDVLYNRDHPLAKTEHKKVVWEEIAEEMGLPGKFNDKKKPQKVLI